MIRRDSYRSSFLLLAATWLFAMGGCNGGGAEPQPDGTLDEGSETGDLWDGSDVDLDTPPESDDISSWEPADPEPQAFHSDGRWIRDERNRVVILRGINYSGLEFGNFFDSAYPPQEGDFEQIAGWGFNVVRLPIAWHYIETAPGTFDETYLEEQVDPVVEMAAGEGLGTVLEVHQYGWSSCFGGNGIPSWSCQEYSPEREGMIAAECDFWSQVPSVDGQPLQDHLVQLWELLADHYRGNPAVIGLDLLNEPPNLGCFGTEAFSRDYLFPLYRRLAGAIRDQGAGQMLFVEPSLARAIGFPFVVDDPGDDNIVYAPHLYTIEFLSLPSMAYSGDPGVIAEDIELALREAERMDAPLWVAEFGGDTNEGYLETTSLFIDHHLSLQDDHLLGGAVWAYFPCDNTFSVVDREGRVKGDLEEILVRPYPLYIAGEPTEISFDRDSARLDLAYETPPQGDPIGDPTVLFVPELHFPYGFEVEVQGVAHYEFNENRRWLIVYRDRAATSHHVSVRGLI